MNETPFFFSRKAWIISLLVIFILGIGIRLYDLTDLPLDFHSTRQLLSALKARGMYYQGLKGIDPEIRTFAIQQWKFRATVEPEFLERIVANTYQYIGGEQLWIPRVFSITFWIIGGFFLFLLARRLTSIDGALAATAFYLFLPYAVIASRSFQPDPLMVMLTILFWWAVYEWAFVSPGGQLVTSDNKQHIKTTLSENKSWLFAILAGLFGGFAIYIKFVAAFFVIGGGIGTLLMRGTLRDALKQPQLYVMGILGIIPGTAYFIYGVFIDGFLRQQFNGRFIPSYLINPSFYLGWVDMLNIVMGGIPIMLALTGLFFYGDKKNRFMLGLWASYVLFGFYFDFHIASHDYYSLPFIPIVALSFAPLAEFVLSKLAQLTSTKFLRFSSYIFLIFGVFASLWSTRNIFNSVNYRPEAEMWAEISRITDGHNVAGLTVDYGSSVAYFGWRTITAWPRYGDYYYRDDLGKAHYNFERRFENIASKKDLFLITDFDDLNRQPFLKEKLTEYPIFAQDDGYVIYNLQP